MNSSFMNYWLSRLQFLDVHYHSNPDSYKRRYTAYEVGLKYANLNGGVVLKNHLGSVSSLATVMQKLNLPVFGSIVLNKIAGGINVLAVKQALSQYQCFESPRLLVHLPTIVKTPHRSTLHRQFSNNYAKEFAQYPLSITDDNDNILPEVEALIEFAQNHNIVISSGHTTKKQTLKLIEAVEKAGGCRLMLNQPANPISGFSARELKAIGSYDWLYIEQSALTVYLKYQSLEDMNQVLSEVNNVVYSSDLGQLDQPDIEKWLSDSKIWFKNAGLKSSHIDSLIRLNPLKMLSP